MTRSPSDASTIDRVARGLPEDEQRWLADYDPRAYEPIAVTVDVLALTIRDRAVPASGSADSRTGSAIGAAAATTTAATTTAAAAAAATDGNKALHVLLVRRSEMPFVGRLALPGGFVKVRTAPDGTRREEDLTDAAARELAEETGLAASGEAVTSGPLDRAHLEQLGTYGKPGRDPRMRVVSVAYLAFAPDLPDPTAGGDAAAAAWVPVDAFAPDDLAFDHADILADGLERARSKIEYTPLATKFTKPEFTMTDLREVYELVWQEPLHAANFHRKVLSVPSFVEDTGATTDRGGRRGGRRARLYRAGTAIRLHPPLLRPSREDPR